MTMLLIIVCLYLDNLSFTLSCEEEVFVTVGGRAVTGIPSNLNSSITHLEIDGTSITTLDLQQLSIYTELCYVDVGSSPITSIITQTQNTKLTRFKLAGADFPVLPNIGVTLSGQLSYCSWSSDGISTIPDGAFIDYDNLVSLSLAGNPITSLEYSMMQGLTKLKFLYLGNTLLTSPPAIYTWAPKLEKMSLNGLGLTELPESLITNLPKLKTVLLEKNELTTLPEKDKFVNLESMNRIDIKENPLTCDYRLCWLKVGAVYYVIYFSSMCNMFALKHTYFEPWITQWRNRSQITMHDCHVESLAHSNIAYQNKQVPRRLLRIWESSVFATR